MPQNLLSKEALHISTAFFAVFIDDKDICPWTFHFDGGCRRGQKLVAGITHRNNLCAEQWHPQASSIITKHYCYWTVKKKKKKLHCIYKSIFLPTLINIDIVSITKCWCFNFISKQRLWVLTRPCQEWLTDLFSFWCVYPCAICVLQVMDHFTSMWHPLAVHTSPIYQHWIPTMLQAFGAALPPTGCDPLTILKMADSGRFKKSWWTVAPAASSLWRNWAAVS